MTIRDDIEFEIERRLADAVQAAVPQLAKDIAAQVAPLVELDAVKSRDAGETLSCEEAALIYGVKPRQMQTICAECNEDGDPIGSLVADRWIVSFKRLRNLIITRGDALGDDLRRADDIHREMKKMRDRALRWRV